jgi:hypothetical protein
MPTEQKQKKMTIMRVLGKKDLDARVTLTVHWQTVRYQQQEAKQNIQFLAGVPVFFLTLTLASDS